MVYITHGIPTKHRHFPPQLLSTLILFTTCLLRYASASVSQPLQSPVITTSIEVDEHNIIQPQDAASEESCISNYLSQQKQKNKNRFYIQGWRWHTLSLVRDSNRLEKLAYRNLSSPSADLEKAAYHVVDFNMKGLHKIENELFFPWLKEKLSNVGEEDPRRAFAKLLKGLDEDRRYVAKLGTALKEQARLASQPDLSPERRIEATNNVAQMSAALTSLTQAIFEKENRYLVPAVAVTVSPKDQKSFNNKVIRKLGILDSRLHLVGMHDAVWERGGDGEKEEFNEAIPYLPRKMIPRWRRLLYEPQAGVLDP